MVRVWSGAKGVSLVPTRSNSVTSLLAMRCRLAPIVALALAGACRDDAGGDGGGTTGGADSTTSTSGSSSSSSESSSSSSTTEPAESSSTGEPIIPIDCTDACIDTTSDPGIALCYSCRCKAAFDNWLPTPDQVQCATADPIVTYHAELGAEDYELVPVDGDPTACANPSLLTSSCAEGSRLGQLRHGDVMLRWICRDPYDDGGRALYSDMGLIGQNTRTGVSCFWDDIDNVTHDDDLPNLDLLEASDEELAHHLSVFYFTNGESCTACHDHDPFIYTPYLESTGWTSVSLDKGPYSLVDLAGAGQAVPAMHLVSPQATMCTACHRIGSGNTCGVFVRDAVALDNGAAYEQSVRDAAMPGSPHWKLAYWMPGDTVILPDFDLWAMAFGSAAQHVVSCCNSPGQAVGDCLWEPIPAQ